MLRRKQISRKFANSKAARRKFKKKSRGSERIKYKSTPKRERMSETEMLTFESIKEKKAKTE